MKNQTQIYIYNENGLINPESIKNFIIEFTRNSMFDFNIKWKSDIDPMSTILSEISDDNLELRIYDYGYVLKLEGSLLKTILCLRDFDIFLDENVRFYISPSQIVENKEELLYQRGSKLKDISLFLDKLFISSEYSKALSSL